MVNLIGISGKKQAGKDTFYRILNVIDEQNLVFIYNNITFDKKDFFNEIKEKIKAEPIQDTPTLLKKKEFAERLKKCVADIIGCRISALENEDFKNMPISWLRKNNTEFYTPRDLLQLFGTDVGRKISPNIWCTPQMMAFDDMMKYSIIPEKWVFTDVRLLNEAKEIKKRGGLLVRINRDNRDTDKKNQNHVSETDLDNYKDWDAIIQNNGTIEDLIIKGFDFYSRYF